NNVQVSYSLTAYNPYEGYRITFNGTKGKLDAWIKERQPWEEDHFDEIQVTTNFGKRKVIRIDNREAGHGGGDVRLRKHIFNPGNEVDTWRQAAGSRDGAMSCLICIAARNSIDTGKQVRIEDLISLKPQTKRPVGNIIDKKINGIAFFPKSFKITGRTRVRRNRSLIENRKLGT